MANPTEQLYTSRALKATALLEETRALLRAWQPGESAASLRVRARREDLLGKATTTRADDVVANAFARRFLVEGSEPAESLRRLLERRGNGEWFIRLCLLYAARADVVLREAVTVFVRDARAAEIGRVSSQGFVAFLARQEECGRTTAPWSASVRERVARHVLHQLSELGVLGEPRGGQREILPFDAGGLCTAWLACDLRRHGIDGTALVEHRDWLIWQMQPESVRASLDRWSHLGLWLIQSAGSVVRISWRWTDWQQVLATLESSHVE